MNGQYTFSKVVFVSESNNAAATFLVLNNPAHKFLKYYKLVVNRE
ncbi:hypothetical protein GGD38_006886 [Chitinophagaceae bacterium OAS944]|nr:hypothetical protein [Chitinophagaceae bacterium OAS944]